MSEFSIKERISLPATYSVNESSEEARNHLALCAAQVESVTKPSEQQQAVTVMRQIKEHISAVATARTSLSRPLDSAKALLIQLERDHIAPLEAEQDRLERLLTAFTATERDRVAAQDELRRNEIARKVAELDRKIEEARALEEAATDEISLNAALTAEVEAHYARGNLYRSMAMAPATPAKVSGVFTNRVMEYEVVDVLALFKARPDLCRLEPNASAIREKCAPGVEIPGLRLWYEDRTTVRR